MLFSYILPTVGRIRDFHPLETCAARRTLNKNDSQLLEVNLLNQLKLAKRVNLFDYSLEELQAVHEYWRSMNRYSKQVLNKEKVA